MSTIKLRKLNASGFTLIEMMVSVLIFGVISSILFPALIDFLETRDRVDIKHQQLIGMQKTLLFVAQDMRFASNRLGKDEFGQVGKATLSVGDDSLIELTALYPDLNLNGVGVPRRVRWVLEDNVLQRVQYPVMDPDSDTRVIRQKLLDKVDRVDIQLREIVDGTEETSDSWSSESRLPDMIDMTIVMQSGIEYRRSFTMLNGDTVDAIAAAQTAGGAGDASNSDSEGDGESEAPVNNASQEGNELPASTSAL